MLLDGVIIQSNRTSIFFVNHIKKHRILQGASMGKRKALPNILNKYFAIYL